jgi:hypothetical protein
MPDDVLTADATDEFEPAADTAGEQAPVEPETAEELSLEPDEAAPYGYMIDPATGLRRAKIRAGRKRKTPVAPVGAGSPVEFDTKINRDEDRAPGAGRDRAKKKPGKPPRAEKAEQPVPPFRAGPIASGMNKLYARVGKVVKVWDDDIGSALISITRKESDDDTTVGEAWEEMARTNPAIRAFLHKMLQGTAWSGLFMVHAPVFLAIMMKDAVRKRLPFNRLFSAFLDPDENGPSEVSEMMGGIQSPDAMQMMNFAMSQMGPMFEAMNIPRSTVINPQSTPEPPDEIWTPADPEGKTL